MLQQPELRLGTTASQAASGSPDWWVSHTDGFAHGVRRMLRALMLSRMRGVADSGIRGEWPSGIGHAIPAGADVALCGVSDLRLWSGPFDPRSRVVQPCADCTRLADSRA